MRRRKTPPADLRDLDGVARRPKPVGARSNGRVFGNEDRRGWRIFFAEKSAPEDCEAQQDWQRGARLGLFRRNAGRKVQRISPAARPERSDPKTGGASREVGKARRGTARGDSAFFHARVPHKRPLDYHGCRTAPGTGG